MSKITPAYAGKSGASAQSGLRAEDHPRVCGEESSSLDVASTSQGSPPRMRGRGGLIAGQVVDAGITPARAGKSVYVHQALDRE